MRRTLVFVFSSLDINRGGMTSAMLTRANTLADQGHNVIIATLVSQMRFAQGRDFQSIVQALRKQGKVHSSVKVKNFVESVTGYDRLISVKEKVRSFLLPVKHNGGHGGEIIRDRLGNARAILFKEGKTVVRETYLDKTGQPSLTVWLQPDVRDSPTVMRGREFTRLTEAHAAWLDSWVPEGSVVFTDERKTDGLMQILTVAGIKKVTVVHSIHTPPDYFKGDKINSSYRRLYKKRQFDLITLNTPTQIADIAAMGFDTSYSVVMPNTYVKNGDLRQKGPIAPKVVTVSRFVEGKGLEDGIRIIKLVAERFPNVKYELYGGGILEGRLKELAAELGLKKNVKIHGYTSDPVGAMAAADCFLFTSHRESFGMTMVESFSAGTPVVAYDICYGPSYVIADGENGFLAPFGDEQAAADQVIRILGDKKLRDTMTEKAFQRSRDFTKDRYIEAWESVLAKL